MVICLEFEFSLNRFGGCKQFRISAYPLGRPADGRAVYIKPADHFASGDQQVLRGHIVPTLQKPEGFRVKASKVKL
jgi:hypothetical protein